VCRPSALADGTMPSMVNRLSPRRSTARTRRFLAKAIRLDSATTVLKGFFLPSVRTYLHVLLCQLLRLLDYDGKPFLRFLLLPSRLQHLRATQWSLRSISCLNCALVRLLRLRLDVPQIWFASLHSLACSAPNDSARPNVVLPITLPSMKICGRLARCLQVPAFPRCARVSCPGATSGTALIHPP
jgi:hypothetical protein